MEGEYDRLTANIRSRSSDLTMRIELHGHLLVLQYVLRILWI